MSHLKHSTALGIKKCVIFRTLTLYNCTVRNTIVARFYLWVILGVLCSESCGSLLSSVPQQVGGENREELTGSSIRWRPKLPSMKKQEEALWSWLVRMGPRAEGLWHEAVGGGRHHSQSGAASARKETLGEQAGDAGVGGGGGRRTREAPQLAGEVRDARSRRTAWDDALSRKGNCPPDGREGVADVSIFQACEESVISTVVHPHHREQQRLWKQPGLQELGCVPSATQL